MAVIIKINGLMAANHISPEQLAQQCGFSSQQMTNLLNGHIRSIRVETIDKLCSIFNCYPGDLMNYTAS